MMNEFHDAAEAAWALRCDTVFLYWAPGDATVYRVTLVRAVEYGLNAMSNQGDVCGLLVLVGVDGYNQVLFIPQHHAWTAEMFAQRFGLPYLGWWAGVRPLLAALEWTPSDERALNYDANDASVIAAVGPTR